MKTILRSVFRRRRSKMQSTLICFSAALLVLAFAAAAQLPVKEGLFLHLDAAGQNSARKAAGLPVLANGGSVDRWLDSSGGSLFAVQPVAAGRPILRMDDQEAFIRFDGRGDFLTLSGLGRRSKDLTLFILAAPRSNRGSFSGFFGAAVAGQNDYTSGLNLDQGPNATRELSVLNVESAGSGGYRNFLQSGRSPAAGLPFEGFHVFTVRSAIGSNGNELFLDGSKVGDKARSESLIGLDEIVIGGRIYSNDGGELPFAQGSFDGDIAAIAIYQRALSDSERKKVEQYLLARLAALNALASGSRGHSLEVLKNPPIVQMFVPGFSVEQLPLKMRNLTNVRYRHDGKLVALGYDGRIHLVTDTDGDGREDQANVFWDKSSLRGPIGMALLPAGDKRGEGVLVASKGKVSLIVDRDRDGVGDEEIIVATGWKEIPQNVDAVGLAVDPKDGSIYFGLGTANYANGYLIDAATGKSRFDLASDRGTIQRVSADFKIRETFCTGVRFTCALAFNREGDLFGSEQEGATWLPNGNPFDELLHLQPGRHYGFPPRHPKHLPQVIDEPAVMEYSPQHQSTVGFIFNYGVNGGPTWGPPSWEGDAILCGESRGKLYRTRLVKTAEGYVGQNHLIGALGMLLVDACVSPKGDLLLACHSGPPDWGTGPAGEGAIFRVRYTKPDLPQPAYAWAAAPDEFRIAFDKPLKDADWAGVREKIRVEAGRYVRAGDRFEVIRPGYQVVRDQMGTPRRWVEVQGLSLTSDRRTLILRVPQQTEPVTYAITIPAPASWQTASPIAQRPELDLALTLNGLQAAVESSSHSDSLRIILPHPSFAVSRAFTFGSADHEKFFRELDAQDATHVLKFRGQIDVANIFVPAIQPGATLDWDIANDSFAGRRMSIRQSLSSSASSEVMLPISSERQTTVAPLQLAFNGRLNLKGSGLSFALDDRQRPIALNKFFPPWTRSIFSKTNEEAALARTDVKGRWLSGRRVFHSDGGCATCHAIRGVGTSFGPDLSNLVYRDRDSVLHDITQPSATINPDMTGSAVKFRDGTVVNGLVQTLSEQKIVIRLPADVRMERPRADVVSIDAMASSLMPEKLEKTLSAEQLEDLLTFLLTYPLEPTIIHRLDPPMPPARTSAEIAPFLPPPSAVPDNSPLRIILCIDEKDHGPDEHDYPLWQQRWAKLLALADGVTVTKARVFPTRAELAEADVAVLYSRNSEWNQSKAALLDEFQQRGGGVVLIHWAMEGGKEALAYAERIGIATGTGSRFRHGALELDFMQPEHPISRGFTRLNLVDESYWAFHGNEQRVVVLAKAVEEQLPRAQLWAYEHLNGRVFGSIPGHYMWTFDDPLYRVLLLRGIAWAGKQKDINRLLELATVGARIAP